MNLETAIKQLKHKTLRKNRDFTAQEVAFKLKIDTIDITKIDNLKLKDVPDRLKSKLLPILRGDYMIILHGDGGSVCPL